jgi:hypothetical protein
MEASPYAYQVAATGTSISFSLTSAPAGATLSGGNISWTPTAEQSRVSNNFTVTATSPGSASATQSWSVEPSGTVHISRVDTLWNENGSTAKAFDWSSVVSSVAALVPQPDGSFRTLSGTAGANGTFEIPNVPAGYYWLKLGPRDTYWTSSSIFDMGTDTFVPGSVSLATTAPTSATNFSFNFTALDPTPARSLLQVDSLETGLPPYSSSITSGSITFLGGWPISGNLDYSAIKTLFVRQYEPTSLGPVSGYVMGPELTLSNQSLTTGGQNTISGSLNPTVPASIGLSVKGSAWAPLFDHIAPTTPTAPGGSVYLAVQPYVPADGPNMLSSNSSGPINLIWSTGSNGSPFGLFSTSCATALTTDMDAGTVRYSDPFPSAWRRTFRVCQSTTVSIPLPGGPTQGFTLTNTQTTALPITTVKPLISSVQNPKINGADLFTAATINGTTATLSWDPPAIGIPYGYTVAILSPTTLVGSSTPLRYVTTTTLSTAKTSIPLPPGVMQSGKTYLFLITALLDGKANMETSPHRSLLPTGSADAISAPITTQSN